MFICRNNKTEKILTFITRNLTMWNDNIKLIELLLINGINYKLINAYGKTFIEYLPLKTALHCQKVIDEITFVKKLKFNVHQELIKCTKNRKYKPHKWGHQGNPKKQICL